MARKLAPALAYINEQLERRYGGIGNVPVSKRRKIIRALAREFRRKK